MCDYYFLLMPYRRTKKSVTLWRVTLLLLHYFQAPQITARDILEYAESEFWDYGQHMVEYVGLNAS